MLLQWTMETPYYYLSHMLVVAWYLTCVSNLLFLSNHWIYFILSLAIVVQPIANGQDTYSERSIILGLFHQCDWGSSWISTCISTRGIPCFTWWPKFGYCLPYPNCLIFLYSSRLRCCISCLYYSCWFWLVVLWLIIFNDLQYFLRHALDIGPDILSGYWNGYF